MPRRGRRTLWTDALGATVIEFAFVAPVLCLVMVGAFDTAHTLYMQSVLQGAVQKAARDSTLESSLDDGAQAALDAKVTAQVKNIAPKGTVTITRRFFRTFSDAAAAKAEVWTVDSNKDGICDNGEPFTDTNNNGIRDMDGGDDGQGGAKDRAVYTVSVTYARFFPLYKFIGGSNTDTIVAKTILENQPYTDQGSYTAPTVGHCP